MSNIKTGKHYINGQWQPGCGDTFISYNPANNQPVWQGTIAGGEEVTQARDAAHHALPGWRKLSVDERAAYLQAFAHQVDKQRQTLAELIALENGKPLWEAQTEVTAVIGKINLSIQAYQERNAEKHSAGAETNSSLRYKSQGVVAVLGPFNFPAHLSNGHIVPALLAGNAVILKPSELTPAVAEFIMQCWDAAKLPAGVINCVFGDSTTGQHLLATDIQGVFFTGSYPTGRKIHQFFSGKPEVILALEMGGNNPLIVDEVADVPAAVYTTLLSAFITAGQRCSCARRLYIPQSSFGDNFLQQLLKATRHIKAAAYTDTPEPFMGPVISLKHAQMHVQAQQQLINLGGQALLPMQLLNNNSALLSAGIIDMSEVINPPDEEIFAPLLQVYRYQDFDDALAQANNTRYGLAAGLLSDNASRYEHFYQTVCAGLINWNRPTTGAASNLPFGGIGCSGNHRPSAYFAADYCTYPVASQEQGKLTLPTQLLPGVTLEK